MANASKPEAAKALRQRRRARAELRRRQGFLADALHQLRNAIATLATQAALLRRAQPGDQSDIAQALERRLLQLGRFLAQLDQLEARRVRPQSVAVFDAAACAREVMLECVVAARERGVDLGWIGTDAIDYPVRGQEAEWREALFNLLDNAIRHTPAGRRVDVSASWEHGCCAVRVADQGGGLSAAGRHALFARHTQALGSDGLHGRSGLGLDIAWRIARANQGRIVVADGLPHASGDVGLAMILLIPGTDI